MSQSESSSITRAVERCWLIMLGIEVSISATKRRCRLTFLQSSDALASIQSYYSCSHHAMPIISELPQYGLVLVRTIGRSAVDGIVLLGTSCPLTPKIVSVVKPVRDAAREKASSLSPRSGRLMTRIFWNCSNIKH